MSSSTSKGKGKESDKEEGVTTYHLQVHPGLEGFDADLDALTTLYEELQQCSVDVADPKLDFLTFASTAHWFGVLTELKVFIPASAEEEHEQEKTKQDEEEEEEEEVQQEITEAERERRAQKKLARKRRRDRRKQREREAKARQMDSGALNSSKTISSPMPSSSKEIAAPNATASASSNRYKPTLQPGPPEPGSKLKPRYVDRRATASTKKPAEVASANTLPKKPQAAAQSGGDQNRSGRGAFRTSQVSLPTILKHDERQELQTITGLLIGFVYLMNKQPAEDYSQSGELHLGVMVDRRHRRRGHALGAIQVALERAFAEQNCVRVQAVVPDTLFKHAAHNVFMKSGFGHEGTRRRAFRSPYSLEFKDLTTFGILATDWEIRHLAALRAGTAAGAPPTLHFPISPTSLWESMLERHQRERQEMLERHEKEREELLRWEDEKDLSLKRTASSKTVGRANYQAFDSIDPEDSGDDFSD